MAEVALTVQFAPETVDFEALGLFARRVRGEYPVRQPQPLAAPMSETFDLVPSLEPVEIRLEGFAHLPRMWLLSHDEVQLVQLQHDRLTLNWREYGRGLGYPRYKALRERFVRLVHALIECAGETGRAADINLCEVMYVNPIELPGVTGRHPDLSKIINVLRPREQPGFLPEPEDLQVNARWRIPGEELGVDDRPIGRLYLSTAPGFRPPENTPIYMVNLISRILPTSGSPEAAMAALDVGHKWAVLAFEDLTTAEMHTRWGLKERA